MGTGFGFLLGTYAESQAQKEKIQTELDNRSATIFLDAARPAEPNFDPKEKAAKLTELIEEAGKKSERSERQKIRETLAESFSSLTPVEYRKVLDEMENNRPKSSAKYPHLMKTEKDDKLSFKTGKDSNYLAGLSWIEMPVKNWNSQAEAEAIKGDLCSSNPGSRNAGMHKLDALTPRQLSVIARNGDLSCRK